MADTSAEFARGRQWHAMQANARKEWQAMRDLAVTIGCRECGMPPGAACVSRLRGEQPRPLKRFPAHATRINDARKAAQR